MEASGAGIGRLDYEDMFKEITSKLYGEDPDHRTSSVQNEFETSVSYKNDEDTGNGTDGSDDGNWTLDDEPLKGTEGSRIAAYRAATATWRCYECGDCMGGGPRDVAEHFMELHSSRLISDELGRARLHSGRKDYLSPIDVKKEELVSYLKNVRDQAERSIQPTRRTQETQTIPATLLPVPPTFLLQELPSTPPQHLHQNSGASMTQNTTATGSSGSSNAAGTGNASSSNSSSNNNSSSGGGTGNNSNSSTNAGSGNNASGKRYTCLYCPYGTDRRDLYTRHENIHREEKPFHCYVCYKPFSRADHVKKHFLRMHRDHTYELSRIRRPVGSASSTPKSLPAVAASIQPSESSSNSSSITTTASNNNNNNANPYSINIFGGLKPPPAPIVATTTAAAAATTYQLQPPTANSVHTASAALYQAASLSSVVAAAAAAANASSIMHQQQPEVNCSAATAPLAVIQAQSARRLQNGGCSTGKSHAKSGSSSSKANQERRYTCCYCSWSGVDNWCLKRHLNTHLKPFACALCEYKAARAERLATHVLKVHNRRQCSRCSYLAEDLAQLQVHQLHVHRVSNSSVAAAAAAAAASATAQQQQSSQAQQQNSDRQPQQPQQPQPIHPVGGGRPPAGPPVFPASSAAIAPATTVIPPTTILGNRSEVASMPGIACWEQETSSCEERFNSLSCDERLNTSGERRSRKQRQPRRIMTQIDNCEIAAVTEMTKEEATQQESKSSENQERVEPVKFRCFLCPKSKSARAYGRKPYHTRASLLLHKLWSHRKQVAHVSPKIMEKPAPAEITLKATVYTGRAL